MTDAEQLELEELARRAHRQDIGALEVLAKTWARLTSINPSEYGTRVRTFMSTWLDEPSPSAEAHRAALTFRANAEAKPS